MSKMSQRLVLGALVVAGVGAALWVRGARQDASAEARTAVQATAPLATGPQAAAPEAAARNKAPGTHGASGSAAPICAPGTACQPHGQGEAAATTAKPSPPPRLVDLGTETCKPCKAMLKVLDQLHARYPATQLRADFINVRTQESEARRFGVRIIPTQVFLSPNGKELFRHVGFISADAIVKKWAELGYPLKPSTSAAGAPAHPGT